MYMTVHVDIIMTVSICIIYIYMYYITPISSFQESEGEVKSEVPQLL